MPNIAMIPPTRLAFATCCIFGVAFVFNITFYSGYASSFVQSGSKLRMRFHRMIDLATGDADSSAVVLKSLQSVRKTASVALNTMVCVIMGSTSRKTAWKSAADTFVVRYSMKGLLSTMEFDVSEYSYSVYIGVDHDDALWHDNATRVFVESMDPRVAVRFVSINNPTRKPCPIFNEVARVAYNDGCDYMFRINDDSEMLHKWTTPFIKALRAMDPPNVGMVGPVCGQGPASTDVLTHDFVHRTHLDIFPEYYSPVFSDWYLDDWITRVYKEVGRSQVMHNVEVLHHVEITRYDVDTSKQTHVNNEVTKNAQLITDWIAYNRKSSHSTATSGSVFRMMPTRAVLSTSDIPAMKFTQPLSANGSVYHPAWVVVTTIFAPSPTILALVDVNEKEGSWCMVVVGDKKTNHSLYQAIQQTTSSCFIYLSPDDQSALPYNILDHIQWNHFGRKNVGYLYAMHHGAEVIYDTDDDNVVNNMEMLRRHIAKYWPRESMTYIPQVKFPNPYVYYSDANIWPRGYPLDLVKMSRAVSFHDVLVVRDVCVIQSLADEEPDVDAVYRMVGTPYPVSFAKDKKLLVVSSTSLTPFNAQATLWFRSGFEGLLLPVSVHGRVSDIWRSYFMSYVFKVNNCDLVFSPPWVRQTRNSHNNIGDFQSELPLYLQSRELMLHILSQNYTTYTSLISGMYEYGVVEKSDVLLAHAWAADLQRVPSPLRRVQVMKHVLIAMGKASFIDSWVTKLSHVSNIWMIYGAYDANPDCKALTRATCLYIPKTTWTTGRNALLAHFIAHQHSELFAHVTYVTIVDADVELACNNGHGEFPVEPTCLRRYLRFVDWVNAPIVTAIGNDFVVDGQIIPAKLDSASKMHTSDAFDAAFNTFHVDTLSIMFPYDTSFDTTSWWIAQSVLWQRVQCFAPYYGVSPLDVYYVNNGHEEYPRGRDRPAEIAKQKQFIQQYNLSDDITTLATDDYKPNWNSAHIVAKRRIVNWHDARLFKLCKERVV